ncbi:MAG: class I SAM-dependent methyltransferase [Gomphosphaeria aponina SAG 52.96 = DSM 107014]|uniref:Class I SAM-dependent methyltransferase n=1 Tax=Gomphosphaeria aponina SAG 52.96 = DSM 107014 TaxID=1521640 RepID=A0A941GPB2_9CHRO|nr:class I SAM-dependent methyltransferase [Gomphosphaeria aponina SAG 52.96 = DSM 107014]
MLKNDLAAVLQELPKNIGKEKHQNFVSKIMTVFGNYSQYYDLLYRDKDYATEAEFIHKLIQNYAPNAQSILELGCGTGHHAELLAKYGYKIQGVDLSEEMLKKAGDRLAQLPPDIANGLKFTQGDIRTLKLNQQFDVIISLFHVISYQTSNPDLLATFETVKKHLKPGGIFIFDCWYGPGVLSDRPSVRVKRLENEQIKVTRIAEPVMYPNKNLVDVNYQVFITNKTTGAVEELQETHTMRYLFKPELELMLSNFQLSIKEYKEWLTQKEPNFDTYGVYFVVSY